MIRPARDSVKLETKPLPWGDGSLVTFPYEPPSGVLGNIAKNLRRRNWLVNALKTLKHVPIDVILVRNDLMSAQVAQAFASRRGIPFIFQISSPDAEFRMRQAKQGHSLVHLYTRLRSYQDLHIRRKLCRRANVVLAISAAMRRHMIEIEHIAAERVFAFPMGFNESRMLDPMRLSEMRVRLNLPESGIMIYSGVLDPVREPHWMLDVLSRVNATLPEVVLLVLTGQTETDPRREQFEREAAMRSVNVKVIGPLPHREVGEYLQCADVMLSPYPPIFEHYVCSPTKSIEALGVGLPVVGNHEVEEHAVILNRSGGGITVPWDIDAFAAAVVGMLSDPDERQRMGERGRLWALQNRTYSSLTDYLETILSAAGSLDALKQLPHISSN
jgi:glycosyltransferase involved in cell wall biosynthesis